MKNVELLTFGKPEDLARAAAAAWLDRIRKAALANRLHFVALSGGRIARKFFAAAVEQARQQAVQFNHVHFFWGDERCVTPDDAESNYRIAHELLLAPLGIPEQHIHRVRGEESPEQAAAAAEEELRRTIAVPSVAQQPALDLIFLGMGEDGHVASLFPNEPEALVRDEAVFRAISHSPKPPPNRITLGYPVIAAARDVWVLISGDGKQGALHDSLRPEGKTPLAHVLRQRPCTRIFSNVR